MTNLTVKSKEDAKEFQKNIDRLVEWDKTWQMEFQLDKCEVNSKTRKKNPVKYPYTLHDNLLKHVDVVKYLVVQISHDLRWNDHIDYVSAKANSTLGFVRRNININNPEVKDRVYKTLVQQSSNIYQLHGTPTHTTAAIKRLSQCNEELLA